jgi:serine/threonine protein kinase
VSDGEKRNLDEILARALTLPPGEARNAYVREANEGDEAQCEALLRLLRAHDRAGQFLTTEPADKIKEQPAPTGVSVPPSDFGPYRRGDLLGKGGMGEVYRAVDMTLDREVAIKVLPPGFDRRPASVARFRREAKALAALNHPSIATLYAFEEVGGRQGLVMELVEGPTLAEHLRRKGRLSLEEALQICRQIAEALETAHAKGIIHRDLKPGNVKLTSDGLVKVLDFGLVKLMDEAALGSTKTPSVSELVESPTAFQECTAPGLVLGTAAYMSPEQAKQMPVDRRADIWAFGCVLFYCLTGRPAFTGDSITETLAAVLHREPDWSALPKDLPPTVHWVVRRCLIKDSRSRLHDIADARVELEAALAEPESSETLLPEGLRKIVQAARRPRKLRTPYLVALVIVLTLVCLIQWFNAHWHPVELERIVFADSAMLASEASPASPASLPKVSPRGTAYVFIQSDSIWIRYLRELSPQPLGGTTGAISPSWSPKGDIIGYLNGDTVFQRSLKTGASKAIIGTLPSSADPQTASLEWVDDDLILVSLSSSDSNVFAVSPRTRKEARLAFAAKPEWGSVNLELGSRLPGGQGCLLVVHSSHDADFIAVWNRESETCREVYRAEPGRCLGSPVYSQQGLLLFHEITPQEQSVSAAIRSIDFSLGDLQVEGSVSTAVFHAAYPSMAERGETLLYASMPERLTLTGEDGGEAVSADSHISVFMKAAAVALATDVGRFVVTRNPFSEQ